MRGWVSGSDRLARELLVLGEQPAAGVGERGVDRQLGAGDRLGRERRDARGERVDERAQLRIGERAVHVTPALGGVGIDVVAPEHDLERTTAPDEPVQSLRAAAARDDPHGDLGLRQDRAPVRREAHVARQRELAAAAPRDPLEDRDRGLRHRAEPVDRRLESPDVVVAVHVVERQRLDQRHVRVRDEERRIGGVEHDHAHGVVGLDLAAEPVELDDEREVEQIDRGVVDRGAGDATGDVDAERVVALVGHGATVRPVVRGPRCFRRGAR